MIKKEETYLGRTVLYSEEFQPAGTFEAYHNAEARLRDLGYTIGSMCASEPIGFADENVCDYVAKWYNIPKEEKKLLDGVMIPLGGFREGGARIIFFTPPKL